MTKMQHQGSLHDQMIELLQLATSNGLYDAADWVAGYLARHGSDVEQIAAWFEGHATAERALLDSDQLRADASARAHERWLVYKASAIAVRQGDWKAKR